MTGEILFPIPPGRASNPVWLGSSWLVDGEVVPLLEYESVGSGWNADLTSLHEEVVGEDHSVDRESRDRAMAEILEAFPETTPVILEVGCSSGYFVNQLCRFFQKSLLSERT